MYRHGLTGTMYVLILSIGGCGLPAYPDEATVKASFQIEFRNADCEIRLIHPPVEQAVNHNTFAYINIQVDAACRDLHGELRDITSNQSWQVSKEPNDLFQGVRRWTRTGG